ncbi:MAG TPA: prepilin-type N-terminal cleavage/methylation domain-containing protein [Candidatus Paceibacterota bacterium]
MEKGFTLIELLIVIAIIAILAGVVFVSLDPLKRFQSARNAARWTDVTAVLSAIKVDQVDNGGSYLSAISGLTSGQNYMISANNTGAAAPVTGCNTNCSAVAAVDRCVLLENGTVGLASEGYLSNVPISPDDPSVPTAWDAAHSGYYVSRDDAKQGAITVGACSAEGGETISVSR